MSQRSHRRPCFRPAHEPLPAARSHTRGLRTRAASDVFNSSTGSSLPGEETSDNGNAISVSRSNGGVGDGVPSQNGTATVTFSGDAAAPALTGSTPYPPPPGQAKLEARLDLIEGWVENRIFNCRFLTLMAVVGSLVGAALCFIKGCIFVAESVRVFTYQCIKGINTGKVIMLLVEALDVYLIGTVMLIFGMGLYELFVHTLNLPSQGEALQGPPGLPERTPRTKSSSLFGLFPLKTRPKWLEINSLDEMKTKLGHVIVMVLLVSLFEKSKKVIITSASDLFLFSASIALASACLFLLAKLHPGLIEDGSPSSAH